MTDATSKAVPDAKAQSAWLTSIILTLVMTAAYLDRSMMAFLVEPIKSDLALTDVEVSLLIGAAFSLFYAIMNVPAGVIVDRVDRRRLMLMTGVLWSGASVGCGLADNFWQLLVARMVLGASEAFIGPSIYALMRDRVAPEQRGRSFSVLGMANYFGGAMSLILGGALLRSAISGQFADLPLIGTLEPWQIVVIAVAIIAFVPVLLLFLLAPDEKRPLQSKGEGTFGAALAHMRTRAAAYAILIGYGVTGSLIAFGVNSWIATIMHRTYEIPLPEVGTTLGPLALVFGLGGLLFCGYLLDRIQKRDGSVRNFAAFSILVAAGAATAMPLSPQAWQAWSLYCVSSFFTGAVFPISLNILSRITPSALMGKLSAFFLLCQSVISQVIGVTLIALIADGLFTGPTALGSGLATHCAIFGCAGLIFALLLNRIDVVGNHESLRAA